MQPRLLLNFSLLVAVIGLSLFLVYGGDKKPVPADVALTTIRPETISHIRILRDEQEAISFALKNGAWMMQQPYQLRANALRINTMLKLLGAHSYAQYPAAEIQLARFQLEHPRVSIEFNDVRVDFGDTSPLGRQRYVLVNNVVHIINDALFLQLQSPPTFFLDTRLLPEHADISAITLPGLALRRQDGVWTVAPPVEAGADAIVELVNAWRDADAISISKYEDTESHGSIRIELARQNVIEFIIAGEPPQLVLARPDLGIQYHLNDYDARRMFLKTTPEQNNDASSPATAH